jgi:hypothetical protein
MENQNQTPQVPQSWKDVTIVPDMPLSAMVQFLNILNQRLCSVEDNTFIKDDQGNMISLTKLYAIQAEEEMRAQMEAAQQEQELRERAE